MVGCDEVRGQRVTKWGMIERRKKQTCIWALKHKHVKYVSFVLFSWCLLNQCFYCWINIFFRHIPLIRSFKSVAYKWNAAFLSIARGKWKILTFLPLYLPWHSISFIFVYFMFIIYCRGFWHLFWTENYNLGITQIPIPQNIYFYVKMSSTIGLSSDVNCVKQLLLVLLATWRRKVQQIFTHKLNQFISSHGETSIFHDCVFTSRKPITWVVHFEVIVPYNIWKKFHYENN